jgi:uncharacterized protein YciI
MVQSGDRLFTILWRRGPAWVAGKPVTEQKLDPHRQYFSDLTQRGVVVLAGPFVDAESGGIAVLRAPDSAAAEAIFRNDPAVEDGVFEGDVRPFYTVFAQMAAETAE